MFSIADDEVVKREEEAIKLDGLNVAQIKELRDKAEKFTFQAEVNRMMKLIINSLYRNKEVSLLEVMELFDKCVSYKQNLYTQPLSTKFRDWFNISANMNPGKRCSRGVFLQTRFRTKDSVHKPSDSTCCTPS
jgi:replication initiation and membrane attachment protein DnaB